MFFLFQSHPLGKGPDFVKGVFNTYGQSPLVAHFMRIKNLKVEAGLHTRIQRTELQNLPPYPFIILIYFHYDKHVLVKYIKTSCKTLKVKKLVA